MASLRELYDTLPAKYTLSNQNLILIAHVRDETVYFYDELGPTTTIILLSQPKCYALKKIFLEFMNDLGTTVIDLRENETFDPGYKLSKRSESIIISILRDYNFEKIITHPKYDINNDPQNRELYDLTIKLMNKYKNNNHYTYNKIGLNGIPKLPCGIKKGILEMYCKILSPNNKLDKETYDNYSSITSNIYGLRKL